VPALDLGTQPETRTASAEIKDRTRHVWVTALILADRVAVGEAEDASDTVSVDEVIKRDASRHATSLHRSADMSYTREHLSVRPGT
jgi:hypothetical protein